MNIPRRPGPNDMVKLLGVGQSADRRRRSLRIAGGTLLVLLLGWWLHALTGSGTATTYETAKVVRTAMTITVQATGQVVPTTQVDVSSEMSGVIRTVNVDNNSLVKKGDVLAELDTVKIKAQLERARASLAAAEARIATAAATAAETSLARDRAAALEKKGISSAQGLEAAQAASDRAAASLKAAEADAAVARADVALEETDLAKSRIVSPVDGIVLKRAAEPGQTVASSLQAPVLFTLAEDLRRMQVEASIDEADIGAVAIGQSASFTVDAYPGRRFPATIESIDYSPTTTENVVTYTAILSVDNAELLLRPGMTTNAEVVVRQIAATLAVPNAALRFEPPRQAESTGFSITRLFLMRMPRSERSSNKATADGERTLYVLDDGAPRAVTVRAGDSDGEMTEIVAGELGEGDPVITAARQGKS